MEEVKTSPSDAVLIIWLIIAAIWDVAVIGITGYLVFWRGHSGWWFVVALILSSQPTLYRALRKRFDIPEEKEEDDE